MKKKEIRMCPKVKVDLNGEQQELQLGTTLEETVLSVMNKKNRAGTTVLDLVEKSFCDSVGVEFTHIDGINYATWPSLNPR